MEYAPLGDLRKYLTATGKPLSSETGALFLKQALEGIDFIHATGVLHRDIKPDNILLINEKEIRLADFGLALLPGDEIDLEELQNGVGSLAYIPPELLEGASYDSRSDLYSLGVCFYEALSGTHPFEHAPLSEQLSVRRDGQVKPLHELNPNIPHHVSAVIATLMRYSADERFQTAIEALRALADTGFTGDNRAPISVEPSDSSDTAWDDAFGLDDDDAVHSLEAANEDVTDLLGDSTFEDLFDPPADIPPVAPTTTEPAQPERTQKPTEEFTAHRIQEMIQSDSRKRADTESRRIQLEREAEATKPPPAPTQTEDLSTDESTNAHAGFSSTPQRSRRTSSFRPMGQNDACRQGSR
jgi:serine/threonine-protein kinase